MQSILNALKTHLPYLSVIFVLYVLLVGGDLYVNHWYNPPFPGESDLTVHIPRLWKLQNPNLYANDPVFELFSFQSFNNRLDNLPFPLLLGVLFPVFGGIRPTLIILAFFLGLIFIIGIYSLTYYLFKDFPSGVIAAFLASFYYPALGGVHLGFTPPLVLPRNFIVALVPAIIILFLHWQTDKKLWLVYALLGLSANFHILAALHLIIVFSLTLIIVTRPFRLAVKKTILMGIITCICALPSIAVFIPGITNMVTVSSGKEPILVSRYAFAVAPTATVLLTFILAFLLFGTLGFWGVFQSLKHQAIKKTKIHIYAVLSLVIFCLPWIGPIINSVTLSFVHLELLRISRYYFLLAFAPAAMVLAGWIKNRSRIRFVLAPIVLSLMVVFSRPPVAATLIQHWLKPPPSIITGNSTGIEWNWNAFYEMSTWIEQNTPETSLFMVPVHWNQFRVYAHRGMVVSWKGTEWPGWSQHYETVKELYNDPNTENFTATAKEYSVDYVITPSQTLLLEFTLVYKNKHYAIYQVN